MQLSISREVDDLSATMPHGVREHLRDMLASPSFSGVVLAEEAQAVAAELGQSFDDLLITLLPFAAAFADPPISRFRVGEVAVGLSGNLYFGCNLEFPGQALSFTVHGEQCTVVNAWMHGEEGLAKLALPAAACGYCRQFLQELDGVSKLQILLPEQPPVFLSELLPAAFGPGSLGVEGRLMRREDHHLSLLHATTDELALAALKAANMSYSPYSTSYSGAAVQCEGGLIFHGSYAESVAFNPSVSPLQAALSCLKISGYSYDSIREAVLVERPEAPVSQRLASQAVLSSISEVELRVAHAD